MFFPQTHRSGAEGEVDFGEVTVNLRGELVICMLLVFRAIVEAHHGQLSSSTRGRRTHHHHPHPAPTSPRTATRPVSTY